ncbi:hypothetical protein T459_11641 [Capsicum annuum]|uniref:KIB1-4 beta-propeller domain-containing protein n=1 Tax=Capsicum annuum TaxID=4072 RepID=A0A2G2ZMH5_CAPAN|nr:hypothetical protein T459_11641 [Capsicum annuum]
MELEAWDLHNDPIRRFIIHCDDLGRSKFFPVSFLNDDDLEHKSSYCNDPDYLVSDHQSHELFIVAHYIIAGIDFQDGKLVFREDNLDHKFPDKTLTFDVFRLDFTNDDHVELQYLDGALRNRAFFIGSNTSFALSTTQFPKLRPNSIYFTDNQTSLYRYRKTLNCGGHDLGIYDYKDRCILSCCYPVDVDKIKRILPTPIWFPPDVDAQNIV